MVSTAVGVAAILAADLFPRPGVFAMNTGKENRPENRRNDSHDDGPRQKKRKNSKDDGPRQKKRKNSKGPRRSEDNAPVPVEAEAADDHGLPPLRLEDFVTECHKVVAEGMKWVEGGSRFRDKSIKGVVRVFECLEETKKAEPAETEMLDAKRLEFLHALLRSESNNIAEIVEAVGRELVEPVLNSRIKETGEAALHVAVKERRSARTLNFLLDFGADPKVQDKNGQTPLHVAAKYRSKDTVQLFLDRGANPTTKDKEGLTACDVADKGRRADIADLLRDRVPEWTDIYLAAEKDNVYAVEAFMKNANLDEKNEEGRTPLHVAAKFGSVRSVKLLVGSGEAHPDVKDKKGQTALHVAAEEILKRRGSNRDREGHVQIVGLLVEFCADSNAQDNDGRTPLHFAAKSGEKDAVEVLVGSGEAHPDVKNKKGQTALHVAAEEGQEEIVRLLLQLCADRSIQSNDDRTPLDVAVAGGKTDIAELLRGRSRTVCDADRAGGEDDNELPTIAPLVSRRMQTRRDKDDGLPPLKKRKTRSAKCARRRP